MTDVQQKLFDAACEIVEDYKEWGEVLQVDENGKYGKTTAIFKLQKAVDDILKLNTTN